VIDYSNHILDLELFEKDVMTNLHWSVDEIEETEYEPLMKIMNASEDNRKFSAEAMMQQWQSLAD